MITSHQIWIGVHSMSAWLCSDWQYYFHFFSPHLCLWWTSQKGFMRYEKCHFASQKYFTLNWSKILKTRREITRLNAKKNVEKNWKLKKKLIFSPHFSQNFTILEKLWNFKSRFNYGVLIFFIHSRCKTHLLYSKNLISKKERKKKRKMARAHLRARCVHLQV